MGIPGAIVIAASILGASLVLGNLYKLERPAGELAGIMWRINTVTGTVAYCGGGTGGPKCVEMGAPWQVWSR